MTTLIPAPGTRRGNSKFHNPKPPPAHDAPERPQEAICGPSGYLCDVGAAFNPVRLSMGVLASLPEWLCWMLLEGVGAGRVRLS